MAWMLAGLMGHLAGRHYSRRGRRRVLRLGRLCADHDGHKTRPFMAQKPIVTAIDAAHWLAMLVGMAEIIGALELRKLKHQQFAPDCPAAKCCS
jgi:hypothetical protein